MTQIKNETAYNAILERVEELLALTDENTPVDSKYNIELDLLTGMVEEYESQYYPVKPPTLAEVLKLRMAEMNLTQAKMAELLNVSAPRISEYVNGKEPTLRVARELVRKLNIDPSIVLGI